VSAPAPGESAGVDEYRELAYTVTTGGVLEILSLKGKEGAAPLPIAPLAGGAVTTVAASGKGQHLLGTSDGRRYRSR
jgi:hypothetical protein